MRISIWFAWATVDNRRVFIRCATLSLCLSLFNAPDVLADPPVVSPATTAPQAGLVDVLTLAPGIRLDMRYAGDGNFVGKRVDGYGAAKCLLLPPAADALNAVENELRRTGHGLLLYDCYRPARAVAHFMRWAADAGDQRTKPTHYPGLDKSALLGEYIAPVSGHSRGSTVDLTLLDCTSADRCVPLDMGTDFDFFDVRANTDSPSITAQQHANRQRLLEAMQRHGFRNYPKEWWHFTFAKGQTEMIFDAPIE